MDGRAAVKTYQEYAAVSARDIPDTSSLPVAPAVYMNALYAGYRY
jgi:hypothetical protein